MSINFDFVDLESFVAVTEAGSFVGAARQLGVSQSALTRRIGKLEAALGARLFDRTTRVVRPTLAAKRFRLRARELLEDARESLLEIRDESAWRDHQKRAIVTIAAVPSALPRLVIPALARFAHGGGGGGEAGRDARVRLIDLLANETAEAVASGEADFGVSSLPPMDDRISFAPLLEDEMALVVRADHPLAGRDAVRWEELSRHSLILPARGGGNRAAIDRALARRGIALKWAFEAPRSSTALELARAGLGVAAVPASAAPAGDGGLVSLRLDAPTVTREIGFVLRRGHDLSDLAAAVRRAIADGAAG